MKKNLMPSRTMVLGGIIHIHALINCNIRLLWYGAEPTKGKKTQTHS